MFNIALAPPPPVGRGGGSVDPGKLALGWSQTKVSLRLAPLSFFGGVVTQSTRRD
jgi:hypothetical protein